MMKNYLYILLLFFFSNSCISEIAFDAGDQEAMVISGVMTNSIGERTIYLSRVKGLKAQSNAIDASGAIYKNGELEAELIQIRLGELAAPFSFRVEEGATYHIEITSADSQVYQSKPQLVPPKIKTDSLSFKLSSRREGFNSLGIPINIWFVDLYAHINVPAQEGTRYYKWQIDESWSFESTRWTCYLSKSVRENPAIVVSSANLARGSVPIRIASVELDDSFLFKHYFNAYLHAIDEASFEFYDKAQRLSNISGNLYDELPAPLQGNVFLSSGEDELVLGNVEFSLADTARLPIDYNELGRQLFNVCNTPSPCPTFGPCACVDCASVFGFASVAKPFYWE